MNAGERRTDHSRWNASENLFSIFQLKLFFKHFSYSYTKDSSLSELWLRASLMCFLPRKVFLATNLRRRRQRVPRLSSNPGRIDPVETVQVSMIPGSTMITTPMTQLIHTRMASGSTDKKAWSRSKSMVQLHVTRHEARRRLNRSWRDAKTC